jgi:hypothetical protein
MEYIKSQKKTVNSCCVMGTDVEKGRRASIPLRGVAMHENWLQGEAVGDGRKLQEGNK